MTYQRKTRDFWSIQQFTGLQYGWEEVCAEESWKDAKRTLREYRENQPEYPVRAQLKRERIERWANPPELSAELLNLLKAAVALREQEWDAERDFEIELGRDIDGLSSIVDDLAICGADSIDETTLEEILDESKL